MTRGKRRSSGLGSANIGLAVVAVLTVLLCGAAMARNISETTSAGATPGYTPPEATEPVRSRWIGDSYATGAPYASEWGSFAALAADELGWEWSIDAIGGTGYVAALPQGGPNYQQRAAAGTEGIAADVTVITGGINDRPLFEAYDLDEDQYAEAVGATLDTLAQNSPGVLVVVGPFSPDAEPKKALLRVRDVIAAEAAERGLPFIDPIAEQWVTAENRGTVIGADGTHPTLEGHAYLAQRLAGALPAVVPPLT